MRPFLIILIFTVLSALFWWKWPHIRAYFSPPRSNITTQIEDSSNSTDYQKAYFAAGCFWCVESSYESYPWILSVTSGYAGGTEISPTYEQVAWGQTSHREAVEVVYDPTIIDYSDLLAIFWRIANPVDDGGQYVDRGFQYTSAIWYQIPEEQSAAEFSKSELQASWRFGSGILVTPILPFTTFYPAENYHQDYYKVNPLHYKVYTGGSGRPEYQKSIWWDDYRYTIPKKMNASAHSQKNIPSNEELKKILTPIQYEVTQNAGTERPFQNEYNDNKRAGIYVDIVSGVPLYSSLDKYDSGTGWPSFTRPISMDNISLHDDNGLFYTRIEVRGALSEAHIGHVFDDGPVDKWGKRYCMNSAALRFVPVEDLEKEWYGEYLSLFDGQ